jgi:hypothetical protein
VTLADQAIAFIKANPGASSRDVAVHCLGVGRARSPERTRIIVLLRSLVDAGKLGKTIRPKTSTAIACNAFRIREDYEPPKDAVLLDPTQRHLIRHVLRWGLSTGRLGKASEDLLAHMEAEEKRLEGGT